MLLGLLFILFFGFWAPATSTGKSSSTDLKSADWTALQLSLDQPAKPVSSSLLAVSLSFTISPRTALTTSHGLDSISSATLSTMKAKALNQHERVADQPAITAERFPRVLQYGRSQRQQRISVTRTVHSEESLSFKASAKHYQAVTSLRLLFSKSNSSVYRTLMRRRSA